MTTNDPRDVSAKIKLKINNYDKVICRRVIEMSHKNFYLPFLETSIFFIHDTLIKGNEHNNLNSDDRN